MHNRKPDTQQEQLKKRKNKQWLKWLCESKTFHLILKLAPVILQLLKWLIEFLQD